MRKSLVFIFILGVLFYGLNIKTPMVEYWDEHEWIGRSYFFELFINRNFNHPLWQGYYSYDQPKLGEYFYGFVLYPKYLKEKVNKPNRYDFGLFLIDNNFYSITGNKYEQYKNSRHDFISWISGLGYSGEYLVSRYGPSFKKTLEIIYFSRFISGIVLSFNLLVVFLFLKNFFSISASIPIVLLYSINTIIFYSGLKATSEPIFILLFCLSSYLLIDILSEKKSSWKKIIFFAIVSSFATSTKLNGILINLIFNVFFIFFMTVNLLRRDWPNVKIFLLKILLVNIIFGSIFIFLNPYTYKKIVANTFYLYQWRYQVTVELQTKIPNTVLKNYFERVKAIYDFFYYHTETNYGLPYIFYQRRYINYGNRYLFRLVKSINRIRTILFICGFIHLLFTSLSDLKKYINYSKVALTKKTVFFLSSIMMLLIVSSYLLINQMRYLIFLILPFLVIEVFGLMNIIRIVKKKLL